MRNASTKDGQLSLRLPLELKQRMETYAALTGRNKSHVVMEAVGEYLTWRTPQVEDLQEAIRAADAGHFATEAEARAVFDRWAGKAAPARAKASPKKSTANTRQR
jgi:RHH-type transcriptional regulator, rel operon repressor / antitoxin RelB